MLKIDLVKTKTIKFLTTIPEKDFSGKIKLQLIKESMKLLNGMINLNINSIKKTKNLKFHYDK